MNADCRTFRDQLAAHLRGLRGGAGLTELSWHEHLLACQECRDLLDAEESLEILLDSLPEPRLPAHLAERVLARLEGARESLDRLLELSTVEAVPPDLARRIAAGIEHKRLVRDLELDRMLDLVPAPTVPEGLERDTLAALASRRVATPVARRPISWLPPLAVAAAALALIATLWLRGAASDGQAGETPTLARRAESAPASGRRDESAPMPRVPRPERPGPESVAAALPRGAQARPQAPVEEVDEELLASLDLLEAWELLNDDELEVLLSSLDPWDEVLLELEAERREASPEERKNG